MKFDIDDLYLAQKDAEAKRARIQEAMEKLKEEEAAIQCEIEEYLVTIRTLRRIMPSSNDTANQDDADEDGGLPRGTARHHIETALNTFSRDGKTAGEIREYIRNRHKVEIPPNTVSVTLNRLKGAGLAKLTGQKWQPAEPLPEEDFSGPQWSPLKPATDLDDDIPF